MGDESKTAMCFCWPFHDVQLEDSSGKEETRYYWVHRPNGEAFDKQMHMYRYIAGTNPGYSFTYGQPVPVISSQGQHYHQPLYTATNPHNTGRDIRSASRAWYGRTSNEVQLDSQIIAAREGAYNAHELTPLNPKPDQMFWCRELDGSWTLRTAFTIENDLRPGRWQVDSQRGFLIFIRAPKDK